MAVVVSTLNMKGGVGKTTLTYNLAWYTSCKRAIKTLVIDLDPQSNISQLFMGDDGYEMYLAEEKASMADIFERPIPIEPRDIIHVIYEGYDGAVIHLLPSRLELSTVLKNPSTNKGRLARFINTIKDNYDLVLIDCPPTESILTIASYLASNYVIIPVKAERLATIGLPLLDRSIQDFNSEHQHQVKVAGLVFNDIDPEDLAETRISKEKVKGFAERNGWCVFENEIRSSRSYLNGTRQGKPIFMTSHTREHVMEEFYLVGDEFLQSIGLRSVEFR